MYNCVYSVKVFTDGVNDFGDDDTIRFTAIVTVTTDSFKFNIRVTSPQAHRTQPIQSYSRILQNQSIKNTVTDQLVEYEQKSNTFGNASKNSNADEDIFIKAVNRRNTRIPKTIGAGSISKSGHFAGVEQKIWLYLYRVKRTVTETIILDYLKEAKPEYAESFEVKELPTINTQNKCFRVGAHFELKNDMYVASFSPDGIGFKRYYFHREKLDANPATQTSFFLT
ncbi:hypothetical protein FQR65_LT06894 [Abscondita terminalis]|nr:hypothetical protein FQR65_LT06894 [Abscondita terminalis]